MLDANHFANTQVIKKLGPKVFFTQITGQTGRTVTEVQFALDSGITFTVQE